MKKWKELSGKEKMMICFVIILVIAILARWGSFKEEVSQTIEKYTEQSTSK
jgi:Tfp pilus assembly protein PilO